MPSQRQMAELARLHQQGKTDEALNRTLALLEHFPDVAPIHSACGRLYAELGNYHEAISQFQQAEQLGVGPVGHAVNKGMCYCHLGDYRLAKLSFEQAAELTADLGETLGKIGSEYREKKQFLQARAFFGTASMLDPKNWQMLKELGNCCLALDDIDAAVAAFSTAVDLRPQWVDGQLMLAHCYRERGQFNQARKTLHAISDLDDLNLQQLFRIGSELRQCGDPDKSAFVFQRLLRESPNLAQVHNSLGSIDKSAGRKAAAERHFRRACELDNEHAGAWLNLSSLIHFDANGDQLNDLVSALEKSVTNSLDSCMLHFAIAKAYDDLAEYELAFQHYQQANNIRAQLSPFDVTAERGKFAAIQSRWQSLPEAIDTELSDTGNGICPVFIVGMPRSGTSLVEQILASHSEIAGAGELHHLPAALRYTHANRRELGGDLLRELRHRYLQGLRDFEYGETLITDKLPQNFLHLGYIARAFPEAKIVHVSRDSRAVCWSMYKHFFASDNIRYANKLNDLVEYWNLYDELMSFWYACLGDRIYGIQYENLTEDPEAEVASLLNYLQLDWQQECLEFHKNRRSVSTASALQVREKIYRGSSEKWKHYEKHVLPFLGNLRR